jgi:hypothetical protein
VDEPESVRSSAALRDSELPLIAVSPAAPKTRRGRRVALGVVVGGAFVGVAWVVSPLWIGVILGAALAFTGQPGYRRLVARFGERRRSVAAAVVTLASGLLALVLGSAALYVLGRWGRTSGAFSTRCTSIVRSSKRSSTTPSPRRRPRSRPPPRSSSRPPGAPRSRS